MPPLEIPLCDACQTALLRREATGILFGVALAAGITAGGMVMIPIKDFGALLCFGAPLLLTFALIGSALARKMPVEAGRYSSLNGTIELRFRRIEYEERFIACIRGFDQKLQPVEGDVRQSVAREMYPATLRRKGNGGIRKLISTILSVLGVIFLVFGGASVLNARKVGIHDPAEFAGYLCGSFVPALLLLAIGWSLARKKQNREPK
jgi:hypothetical protein